ncbi:ABC transporter ATP-binding protein [Ensifer adhaerens]|uniref:ABC transporter ATP-binding protein n=1 Tax=Ensifer adhaerens TaxID=106592 RepID=UPI001CC06EB7|nr:ABC transporter ATP-binding protein [Ensifer adhaerens]MBZ7924233.1 ABC transporter ATP-binding protein [Ensifer adhaerens]UAX96513.1 ABC transporter ATP-binding protein [Ensifer adhaerens]UAY04143.1 ABC transporter ATP-binding protein [Ensifer adhaerens]UAY12129.1 ABC transporter ATP-binding protein [Ensifer adhaerens]
MENDTELEVRNISVNRLGLPVVSNVSLTAPTGEMTVLLGANGAGRTTLLEALSGGIPIAHGSARLGGIELNGASPLKRTRAGLGHVEQGRTVFSELTVEENLLVCRPKEHISAAFTWFPELSKRRNTRAGMLSGGEQQLLVIARALLCAPRVLMIDEMSLGLAPIIVRRLLSTLKELVSEGLGVLLVEQFAHLALSYGDTAYVMSGGRIVLKEECKSLIKTPERLHEAYLF